LSLRCEVADLRRRRHPARHRQHHPRALRRRRARRSGRPRLWPEPSSPGVSSRPKRSTTGKSRQTGGAFPRAPDVATSPWGGDILRGMAEKRVVLRDIAEKAGVHLTTVARAIKNDPRVKPKTLEHIQTIAKEMGYMPDPMLAALSTYRIATRPTLYHGTVAWVTDFPTRDGWLVESFEHYRRGAAEALGRHGY